MKMPEGYKTVYDIGRELDLKGNRMSMAYKMLNKLEKNGELTVKRESGKVLLDEEGQAILISALKDKIISRNSSGNNPDESGNKKGSTENSETHSIDNNSKNITDDNGTIFDNNSGNTSTIPRNGAETAIVQAMETLTQQLSEKDKQICNLQDQLNVKDRQIESLTGLLNQAHTLVAMNRPEALPEPDEGEAQRRSFFEWFRSRWKQ